MCELVAFNSKSYPLGWGNEWDFPEGTEVNNLAPGEGFVFQCWHPEEGEWSTMLPPVEGMAWKMPPGSKLRHIPAEDAPPPAPSMVEQVEAVKA